MSNPLLRSRRVFAARIENVIGEAETLSTADTEFNAFNSIIQANIEMYQRENPSGFGSLEAIPGPSAGTATFTTELYGNGSGGVPFWADVLLPACGYVRNGSTFTLRSSGPGPLASDPKTATIASYQDGRLKQLHGAAGTFAIQYEQAKPIMFNWTFSGIFSLPIDLALIQKVVPDQQPIRFAGIDLQVGGSAPGCVNSMSIDAANEVKLRPCANEISAIESGIVTNGKPTITLDPESQLVSDDPTFNRWLAGESETFSLVASNGIDMVTFAGPRFQRTNIQEAEREGVETDNTTGQFNIDQGEDAFSITFGPATTPLPPAPAAP